MQTAHPYILVTNDDGIDSPELLALKQALAAEGQVVVVAPNHNWSAAGHTKTI
ncbi:MAG: 5'/3'-nucleotidase SurE [Anaerolineae bacterium]